jgi:hypothetical protein
MGAAGDRDVNEDNDLTVRTSARAPVDEALVAHGSAPMTAVVAHRPVKLLFKARWGPATNYWNGVTARRCWSRPTLPNVVRDVSAICAGVPLLGLLYAPGL